MKRQSWHKVKECIKPGRYYTETLDIKYGGMTFEQIRQQLDEIEKQYGDQFENFKVEMEKEWELGDEIIVANIKGFRSETDEEYAARLDKKKKLEEEQEKRDKKTYELLKQKYEKNNST